MPPVLTGRTRDRRAINGCGVGMILGHLSVNVLYVWGIGIVLLGVALWYGLRRGGNLRHSERARLDENTRAAQVRDDPQKH
jgi:hypothetical protein